MVKEDVSVYCVVFAASNSLLFGAGRKGVWIKGVTVSAVRGGLHSPGSNSSDTRCSMLGGSSFKLQGKRKLKAFDISLSTSIYNIIYLKSARVTEFHTAESSSVQKKV